MDLSKLFVHLPSTRPFAIVSGKTVTEIDFFNDVGAWVSTLTPYSGTKVVVYSENTYRFACILFASWLVGCTTVLPSDLTPHTISRLKDHCSAFVVDHSIDNFGVKILLSPAAPCLPPSRELPLESPLVELFTSGSTGEPTLIKKRLSQLFEDVENLDSDFSTRPSAGTIVFSTVPHQHIYGFLWRLLWPISRSMVITDERLLFPETIRDRLTAHSSCLFVSSPAILKRLPTDLDWTSARTNCIALVSSGGPLFDDGLRNCSTIFGQTPYEIFGSTELDGVAWRQRLFDDTNQIIEVSTRWKPMPGVEIKASDDNLLWVRSIRLNKNEWVSGGDQIQCFEDGTFALRKRVDRIVKIEEKRVSLDAIEQTICASSLVKECKSFVPNSLQNTLAAVVVPSDKGLNVLRTQGKIALVKSLKKELLQRFESVTLPHHWRFSAMLPTDARGKTSLAILEAELDHRLLTPLDWSITSNQIRLVLNVAASNPYFDGHFPEIAIFPGVAQLHNAIWFANRYLGTPLSVREVKNLKFQSLLIPNSKVVLDAKLNTSTQSLTFTFTDEANSEKRYSSGCICFGDARV